MTFATRPQHLFLGANSYRKAMGEIDPAIQAGSHALLMPFYFLGGFAIELGLKAAILRTRGNAKELLSIGHNLNRALDAAVACGFAPVDLPHLRRLVEDMAPSHGDHSFRYLPDVERISIPRPEVVLGGLDSMLMQIAQQFDVWEDQS